MTTASKQTYKLPSHPSLVSGDPLSLCDTENPTFWDIISVSINKLGTNPHLSGLPALIENLIYSLHGNGKSDLNFLRLWLLDFESSVGQSLASEIALNILKSALSLPELFPSHELTHLGANSASAKLSLPQIRALLAHQILCTTTTPRGNNWGCTLQCWYSSPQPMEYVVGGYLETTFRFFADMDDEQLSKTAVYQWFCLPPTTTDLRLSQWLDCVTPLFQHLKFEPVNVKTVSFPHPTIHCMLVSSHKEPGFGSSCTQEELITAACPQLLPLGALLVQPPIPDKAVLVAQEIYPKSSWSGQGRTARLERFIDTPIAPYTFLFLDALELDNFEVDTSSRIPDLIPENLIRELEKAYTGFMALSRVGVDHVVSPLWGSGAFGGDPIVKSIVLGMAAARAGIFVTLTIDENRPSGSTNVLNVLSLMKVSLQEVRVTDALATLFSVPVDCQQWFEYFMAQLIRH